MSIKNKISLAYPAGVLYIQFMIKGKEKEKVLQRLNRIEGQMRGIQKMVEEDRYCMDILNQTRAAAAAIKKVESRIMEGHLRHCVTESFQQGSENDKREKIQEVLSIFENYTGGNP